MSKIVYGKNLPTLPFNSVMVNKKLLEFLQVIIVINNMDGLNVLKLSMRKKKNVLKLAQVLVIKVNAQ
jgi:hypothetical protein